MGYEPAVLRRASRRLEEQRLRRAAEQERAQREIYARLPRAAEIDKELKGTIYQIIAASLKEGRDPVPAIGAVRDRNMELQAERARLLAEHGYSPDALDGRPACAKCNDTGWVGSQMCSFLQALCMEEQIK